MPIHRATSATFTPDQPALLFLSHSGTDTERARELARSLWEAGLEVWLDVERLQPGDRWMPALEEAITDSGAFVVYAGARGVLGWVDEEVRVALQRSVSDQSFRIIPVLGPGAEGPKALPPFLAQQRVFYQSEVVRLLANVFQYPINQALLEGSASERNGPSITAREAAHFRSSARKQVTTRRPP